MTWETRNGKGSYYTRSKKLNGRVVREYVGTGRVGELAAATDRLRSGWRQATQEHWRIEKLAMAELENAVATYFEMVKLVQSLLVVNSGYYKHHGGAWRRRRGWS